MEHSNSETFQGPSKTYSVSRTFKGLDIFSKFKNFQGLLNDPMNPDLRMLRSTIDILCRGKQTRNTYCHKQAAVLATSADAAQREDEHDYDASGRNE